MDERILRLLRCSHLILSHPRLAELSPVDRCRGFYDAAAFCAVAVVFANNDSLRVKWEFVLSYLPQHEHFEDLHLPAQVLTKIYAGIKTDAILPSEEDAKRAAEAASQIHRQVASWLRTKALLAAWDASGVSRH